MLSHSELRRRMYPDNEAGGVVLYSKDLLTEAKVPDIIGPAAPDYCAAPRLVPGRCYVVVRMGTHMGVAYRNIISATVLRFVRFEAPDDDLKDAHAEAATWALRSREIELEECKQFFERCKSGDESDEDVGEQEENVAYAKSALVNERRRWRMADDRVLVFDRITAHHPDDIDGYFGVVLKDVYSSSSQRTVILPLHYSAIDKCRDAEDGLDITWQSLDVAARGLAAWRLRSAALHKRHWAASVLQRRWRKAMVDPAYLVCQRRLKAEFASMNGPLTKKQRR
jgi:hypothetical protein